MQTENKLKKKIIYSGVIIVFILLIVGSYFYGKSNKDLLDCNVDELNYSSESEIEENTDELINVNLVTVPIANKEIKATQQITADDITWVEINKDLLDNISICTSLLEIAGLYVNSGSYISEGSFFYSSQIVTKSELPNSVFDDIPEGYTLYYLSVDYISSYGNSFYPGDKIDLYVSFTNDAGILYFSKLFESVEILAVRTSTNEDIYASSSVGEPALILFALSDEYYSLLMRASYIEGIEIIPVPVNQVYSSESGVSIGSDYIESIINSSTQNIN